MNPNKGCLLYSFCLFILSCGLTKRTTHPGTGTIIIVPADSIIYVRSVKKAKVPDIDPVLEKYANHLKVDQKIIRNTRLYHFIDDWLNTPYLWGGTGKKGIDCSAFVQRLLLEVYNIKIPRTSVEQLLAKKVEPYSSRDYLSEGDLVFFRTMPNTYVSHVGIYLHNGMFINSSSRGVSIAKLDDGYWERRYVAAGRVKAE